MVLYIIEEVSPARDNWDNNGEMLDVIVAERHEEKLFSKQQRETTMRVYNTVGPRKYF